jgi:hypothetical protein
MFVMNDSPFDVRLKKGHVTDRLAVGALVVTVVHRADGERLQPLDELPARAPGDPPDTGLYVLWEGVSVTASGHALGPSKPPYLQPVIFDVGGAVRRVVVFGDRVWAKQFGGGLVPSDPLPFESIPIGFDRAFGGGWDEPPGLMASTNLPHPGYRHAHPLNPGGQGYYPDAERARGAPLPNVERPEALIQRWNDAPDPAGLSPCKELVGYRLRDEALAHMRAEGALGRPPEQAESPPLSLRMLHHAPPDLMFDSLPQGARIELHGLGKGSVQFALPPCPVSAVVRGKRGDTHVVPRLRAVHVDADRRHVRVVHDLSFRYDPVRPPSRVRIRTLAAEARS